VIKYKRKDLKRILSKIKTIAIVGASPRPDRDSYLVMEALINFGYEIFPVNPLFADTKILGRPCYPNLKDIKEKIDMVDIFRSKEFILGHTKEAIEINAEVLWVQEGLSVPSVANLTSNVSMVVVIDECPKKVLEA